MIAIFVLFSHFLIEDDTSLNKFQKTTAVAKAIILTSKKETFPLGSES